MIIQLFFLARFHHPWRSGTDNLFLKGNGQPTVKSLKNVEKTFFFLLAMLSNFQNTFKMRHDMWF